MMAMLHINHPPPPTAAAPLQFFSELLRATGAAYGSRSCSRHQANHCRSWVVQAWLVTADQ